MAKLFETTVLNGLSIKNRLIRSATWEGMAEKDGAPRPELAELMARLAEGDVGLIISSHAYVTVEGQGSPLQLGNYGDHLLPGLTRLASAVHDAGGKTMLQLAHAGCRAPKRLTGTIALGPSVPEDPKNPPSREMTVDDIHAVTAAFTAGALRAGKAGFDGVQVHAAHGYLFSQFLSPFYNKREDAYGGTIENRARFLLETVRAIRAAMGADFPLLVKMNSEDFLDDGLTRSEMLSAAEMLQNAGVDAIELSGGTSASGNLGPVRAGKIEPGENEGYYRGAAAEYKAKMNIPLILVGGIRSYATAEQLVSQNLADYIALCRPLIREPRLVKRWQAGDRTPAACVSCNLCFRPALTGKGLYCAAE